MTNGIIQEKISALSLMKAALFALVLFGSIVLLVPAARAATNISSSTTDHWAWNDTIGWMDFYATNTVNVNAKTLTGYASSSVGEISLDCHTTSIGDICGTSNYGVTNDGGGNLSGYAWNDAVGWVSFDCHNNGGCGTSAYQVYVDASGNFQNYAWNDVVGWISFNCANTSGCGQSLYRVSTSWIATSTSGVLDSSTLDTRSSGGAQINSFVWHGSQPAGTAVWVQFAVSNASSGPWTNFMGPSGGNDTYYVVGPDIPQKLDYSLFNNYRYFRYRLTLISNQTQTLTPQVDDFVVNWSP